MVQEGGVLKKLGLTRDRLLSGLQQVRGNQRVTSQDPESTYQSLVKYGRDLTQLAGQGKLDPVIGRDDEIRRVIQILSRRTKNNPVLIGEPGVGKTAIVEGLAIRIIKGDVPEGLKQKKSSPWTWDRWSPARNFAANSRNGSRRCSRKFNRLRDKFCCLSRVAHRRRSRRCRRVDGCGEPAQADAGAG